MVKQLLLTTALAAFMVAPALAQDNSAQPSQSPTMETTPPATENQAAPATPPAPTAQDQAAPATPPAPTAQDQAAPATPPAETAEQQVTPPPADAIISAENATDMRADKLIGTSVYNAEGQEVGSVQDIVFDKDGKIVGVVLKVGGLLGIGGKSVGIKWDEVQVAPQEDALKVNYSKDQLKVAPDFKTKDAVAAEQQQPMAPSSPTSTQ
jgi:sporulation protein YlmC with PRC-barrel domain